MKTLFSLVFSFYTVFLFSQDLSSEQLQSIDRLFADFEADDRPGYAIGIYKNGQAILTKSYGIANLDYGIPITAQSVFNVASISKQFTAACAAQLMLTGQLSLEDNAAKFIPELDKYPHKIKIKHLIYMCSGLKEYYRQPRPTGLDWNPAHYFTIDTAIQASLSQAELNYPPGSQRSYSNINYMLLAKIVEKISGMSLDEFAQKHLFEPLGMTNTHFNIDETSVVPNRVIGYNYRNQEQGKTAGFHHHIRNSPHYGGSGLHTTVEDLAKWNANFISKEKLGGQAFYDLMHQTMKFEFERNNEGFGLGINQYKGLDIVQYDGGDQGFSSYVGRFQEEGITIICLSNLGTGRCWNYGHALIDIVMEDKFVYPTPKMDGNASFFLKGFQEAKHVFLAGEFNNWNSWDIQLKKAANGWECKIDLPSGNHHYQFVVDNKWILDPNNPNRAKGKTGILNSVKTIK